MGKQEIAAIEAELARTIRAGDDAGAGRLWQRLLEAVPDHKGALQALAQRAFARRDKEQARALLERLVKVEKSDPATWVNLAMVCQAQQDDRGEEAALHGALVADPQDLPALLLKGALCERQGRQHEAARLFGAANAVASPSDRHHPHFRPLLERASAFREEYNRAFAAHVDAYLAPFLKEFRGEDIARFGDSVDIMFGRKRRYESQSASYHYPGLLPLEFYPRAQFPWLDGIEADTDAIRDEFLAVLDSDTGFTPYMQYPDDVPLNQWVELNNSRDWSAFHLYQAGQQVAANAARCPRTMTALASAPLPRQASRTPTAMFSLLRPRTHIPPHTGSSNTRLLVHLPLIVPEDCAIRVGNEVRGWVPGNAMVFDDTIEHEAWNRSDKLRVVLIFDIWHPALSHAERTLVSALTEGIQEFTQEVQGYGG